MEKEKKSDRYISGAEARRLRRDNKREMLRLEKRKKAHIGEGQYLARMKNDQNLVEFEDLNVYFFTDGGVVKSVNGVSFDIPSGKTVGVIGESGCGKSVTALSLLQLIQAPQGQIVSGSIRFKTNDFERDDSGSPIPVYEYAPDADGKPAPVLTEKTDKRGKPVLDPDGKPLFVQKQLISEDGLPVFEMVDKTVDIAKMPVAALQKIRGRDITMIFQEPMTSLNPVFTIGWQLDEVTLLHVPGTTRKTARGHSIKMLELVGMAIPEKVCGQYPHELSGGMRQRVMIAMALACKPKLIIADEPTTALDVTIQAQILELLRNIKSQVGCGIMLITHDLGVIAEMADYVVVMYAGKVVETGTTEEIFAAALHPYTIGLQRSILSVNKKVGRLQSIAGQVPNPINMPDYCYYRDRCKSAFSACGGKPPRLCKVSDTHSVSCYLYDKAAGEAGGEA
ncbi:MAG: ABC transporter ATP-binding protein [Clostridiales bacterium]|jgi:oligopeptide/dipeptide ABC transporter ATP-binding protein|nr:ABC transporter ATP-binding protein [Clostridiales bacterium]